jgi:uncharacterized protein YkwD
MFIIVSMRRDVWLILEGAALRWAFALALLMLCTAAFGGEPPFAELERQMFEQVNKDRKAQGKPPLKYSDAFATVARGHSSDMEKNAFFGHQSPTTGTLADRLAKAKVRVRAAGENVARNQTVEDAQKRLMESPGHRANVLNETHTHVGIGIVRGSVGSYYITQVFGTPVPRFDPARTHEAVLTQLNKERLAQGKQPFKMHADLNQAAARQAAAMAKAGKSVAVNTGAIARAAGLPPRRLFSVHALTWDPEGLAQAEALHKPRSGRIGIGLAENTEHENLGLGIVWTVVLFTNE